MSRRAVIAGLFFLAACGGPAGENSSSGSVKGVSFSPTEPYAIYMVKGNPILQDKLVILISDDPDSCEHLENVDSSEQPYLKMPDGSHAPSIWMKTNDHTDILTDMRGVGDDLYASFDPGAAKGSDCAAAPCEGKWIAASKGTLEINASSDPSSAGAWAAGSYYLTFDGEQISGTFRAKPCKTMKIDGCSVVAGGSFPALGLLALALLKRRRSSQA
ncbi:MAG TPA: hypothetical protein VGK67_11355 [Myxococcales bacterium]|jgi:hypothetical protein